MTLTCEVGSRFICTLTVITVQVIYDPHYTTTVVIFIVDSFRYTTTRYYYYCSDIHRGLFQVHYYTILLHDITTTVVIFIVDSFRYTTTQYYYTILLLL